MNNDSTHIQLEALLFALGRPASYDELARTLEVSVEDVRTVVQSTHTQQRGIVFVEDGHTVELRAHPTTAALIERVRKEEFSRDIGRAGLEALAAIVYRGPLSRSDIDFIRGVNSSQTLRTLLMRGLVRRVQNPRDERSFLYEPTTELLAQLGITHLTEVPGYDSIREKLAALEASWRAASYS